MVHTRHTRDVEISSPPRFVSLEDTKPRKTRSSGADFDEHDSDHSGIVYQKKEDNVFEEKVVESRLRPRTGPSRSYNYVFADSSDDDVTSRRRTRMLREEEYDISRRTVHRRRMQSQQSSDEEDDRKDRRSHWRKTKSQDRFKTQNEKKTRRNSQSDEENDDDEDNEDHSREEIDDDNDEEDLNNSAVRRSKRLRRKPSRFRGTTRNGKGDSAENKQKGKRCHSDEPDNSSEEFQDMYSRVKRARTKKTDEEGQENSDSTSEETPDDDKNDSENEAPRRRSYSLREHKPRTQLYIAPAIEGKKRTKQTSLFHRDSTPPPLRRKPKQAAYCSPAQLRRPTIRKRRAFHGNSSSTSSDSDSGTETSDEQRFSRRKAKSMVKARSRICPMNFTTDMVSSSRVMKDRVRTGASLADVDPMEIDKSVTFDSVGGLQEHIMKLKEMVVFPLLYPEFYEKFKVAPSRGVLFYGPPGTGKTLVARALANECSQGTQKVAFFMRKGADCLSKWVGEAERQLRLLFDKAYEMRPSIIFFDEIDGLAPVRSSRQDQIHSSIVSTLLALMDGIDSRGEIVVIGATNRIDSIDPALRRPGRFDREFHFPLPNLQDRMKILKIHTKDWNPPLRDDFLSELTEKCAGYCGADLKSLVTEATQNALRRRYPQIYTTSDKLQLDVASIILSASDFARAILNIVPAAQRAVPNPATALEVSVRPLLTSALNKLSTALATRFPYSKLAAKQSSAKALQGNDAANPVFDLPVDEEDNAPSIFQPVSRGNRAHSQQALAAVSFLKFASGSSSLPLVFRPRMLVSGLPGQGQSVHLAPAALHLMEHLPVHILNPATLFAASAKMPEEACANVFHEAKRTAPSIIYIPYINELWGVVSDSMRVTFMTLIRSMSPSTPILMLATSENTYGELDYQLKALFSVCSGEVVEVDSPTKEERQAFFHDLILHQTVQAPPTHRQAENALAMDNTCHFFPKKGKKKKTDVCEEYELGPKLTIACEVNCRLQDAPNPRSKQTKISKISFAEKSHRNLRGSAGEGPQCEEKPLCNILPSTSSGRQGITSSVNRTRSLSRHQVQSTKSKASQRVLATSSSRSEKQLSKVPHQNRRSDDSLRRKAISNSSREMTVAQKSTRQTTPCTRMRQKPRDSLNSNYSASSFLVPQMPFVTQMPVCPLPPTHLIKRYPSRRSPYNKKLEPCQDVDIFQTWQQFNALPQTFRQTRARRVLEPLAKAPPPEPRKLTEREQKKLYDQEEDTLRELRIFLRDILGKMGREKKFTIFTKPVDVQEVPDYYDIIKNPMDLSTMMSKIDLHKYNTASAFLDDIFLICSNALEYNPDRGPTDRGIRHRACALRDMAQALLKTELDPEFERLCQEIAQSRKSRGADSSKTAPAFYHTRPLIGKYATTDSVPESAKSVPSLPNVSSVPEGSRYSRRVRGLDADRTLSPQVEMKDAEVEKSPMSSKQDSSNKGQSIVTETSTPQSESEGTEKSTKKVSDQKLLPSSADQSEKSVEPSRDQANCLCPSSSSKGLTPNHSGKNSKGSSDSKPSSVRATKKAMIKKCPWLATRRRRRHHSTPAHRQELASPGSDLEMVTDEDSANFESTPDSKQPEVWDTLPRSQHEHSPTSAANPANVNSGRRTRGSIDHLVELHPAEGSAKDQPKDPSSLHSKGSVDSQPHKSAAARSLDVELMGVAMDSGISSESNGDSRDSLDHNNSNRTGGNAENQEHVGDSTHAVASTSGVVSASFTRTRSRTQNPLQVSALAALEAEMGQVVVVVDKDRLKGLLDKVVHSTKGFTVERLQHLYSVLSCTIYNHRYQLDKTLLVQEMEVAVENACLETEYH